MKVATWNVNGIRARHAEVLAWVQTEQPDVVCLQELKAQVTELPDTLCAGLGDYWCYWHGNKGYSGVALHVRKSLSASAPAFAHPNFDHESRIVTAQFGDVVFASVYVPNGGKDFAAKLRFLDALERYAAELRTGGRNLILCGDLNIARTDRDVHPKERKANAIGQRDDERAKLESLLTAGALTDLGRAKDPDNDNLFTWWAPWRNLRQRNIGWRLDYVLAAPALAARTVACPSYREVGTSDHGPVIAVIEGSV